MSRHTERRSDWLSGTPPPPQHEAIHGEPHEEAQRRQKNRVKVAGHGAEPQRGQDNDQDRGDAARGRHERSRQADADTPRRVVEHDRTDA